MRTLRAPSQTALLAAAFALSCAAALPAGCLPPAGECQNLADCDVGKVCSKDGACVDDTTGGGGIPGADAGPGTDGGGDEDGGTGDGGPRVSEARLTTEDPVLSLHRDPRPGHAGDLLVSERGPSFDRLTELDPAAATLGDTAFDFDEIAPAEACGVDVLRYETEPNLTDAAVDEVWFVCTEGDPWRIRYTDDVTDPGVDDAMVAPELVARFPTDSQDRQHALLAARGDALLYALEFPENPVAREEARPITTVDAPTFGAIAQLFALTPAVDATAQDYAAVFDRGSSPGDERLVALQREDTDAFWTVNPDLGAQGVRALPSGTTAVAIIGPVDTNGIDSPDAPNLIAFVPAEGKVYYMAWEQEGLLDDDIVYEQTTSFRGAVPEVDEKIFLEAVEGQGIFFATTKSWHAWRIPYDPIDDGDVLTVEFDDALDLPNGMVPFDATHAWFSFAGDDEQVRRLELRP